MLNVHTFTSIVCKGTINGTGQVSYLRRIDIPEIRIFGFQIRRPETEYIIGFSDVVLDSGTRIDGVSERNITETKFNSLRIGDRLEIQFIMTQHFTGGPTTLYASNFTCIERQEALTLS